MSEPYRMILADDHQILTSGLKMTIDEWEEFSVIGVAHNGRETVEMTRTLHPDLVLMDMRMPVLSGGEAAAMIKHEFPQVRIAALTTFDDTETVMAALRAGVDGFFLKVIEPERLRESLHSVMNGISVFDDSAMKKIRHKVALNVSENFSEREKLILKLVCQGLTNTEIAERLSLRPGTVKNLISLLLSKTFCVSRAHLAKYAMENGLVD